MKFNSRRKEWFRIVYNINICHVIISFFFRTGKIRPLLSSRETLRKVRYKYIVRVQVERTRAKLYLEFSLPFVIKCFAPEGAGIKVEKYAWWTICSSCIVLRQRRMREGGGRGEKRSSRQIRSWFIDDSATIPLMTPLMRNIRPKFLGPAFHHGRPICRVILHCMHKLGEAISNFTSLYIARVNLGL